MIYTITHIKKLFNSERGFFYKGIRIEDGSIAPDTTIDLSAFFGVYMFGLFPLDSEEVVRSFTTLVNDVMVYDVPGLPRYEHDDYHRNEHTGLGNFWYITSLWVAQYCQETNNTELRDKILTWVESMAGSSHMLSEQLNPETAEPLSVSPLVWSHAEYMATLLDQIDGEPRG